MDDIYIDRWLARGVGGWCVKKKAHDKTPSKKKQRGERIGKTRSPDDGVYCFMLSSVGRPSFVLDGAHSHPPHSACLLFVFFFFSFFNSSSSISSHN